MNNYTRLFYENNKIIDKHLKGYVEEINFANINKYTGVKYFRKDKNLNKFIFQGDGLFIELKNNFIYMKKNIYTYQIYYKEIMIYVQKNKNNYNKIQENNSIIEKLGGKVINSYPSIIDKLKFIQTDNNEIKTRINSIYKDFKFYDLIDRNNLEIGFFVRTITLDLHKCSVVGLITDIIYDENNIMKIVKLYNINNNIQWSVVPQKLYFIKLDQLKNKIQKYRDLM